MKRVKLAIFSAFYPFRGGIAQFNACLYRALEKQADVCAFTFKKQYPNFLFPGTTQYVSSQDKADPIPAKRIVSTFNPFSYLSAARAIKSSHPDVFVANYWMSFFALFLGFFSIILPRRIKKVAILHNLVPHEKRFFDTFFNRYFVRRYQGFVVMSDSVQNELLAIKPDANILRVNHPWYDHFGNKIPREIASNKLGISPNRKTLLFFGIIRHYKGLDILLDAFEHLTDDYQLIVAGEVYGKDFDYVSRIDHSPAKQRIFFFNRYISDEEVSLFFSASDCCVLPYRSATQSGITATAFHFEVPIVATDVGGLKSIVMDDYMGVVVKEPKAEDLVNGIEKMFHEDLIGRLQKNIQMEKAGNTWNAFAKKVIDFTETIK